MRKLACILLLLVASAALWAAKTKQAAPPPPPPPPAPPGERLVDERGRLALSNKFYLELSVGALEIRICHSGIAVATYKLTSLQVAYPRVFWIPRQSFGPWIDDAWSKARLDPTKVVQRVRIVPGDTSTIPTPDKPEVIPPSLEELTPVPQSYAVRCEGDRAIVFDLEGRIPGAVLKTEDSRSHWHSFLTALGFEPTESFRLRARLPAPEGAAFYRSFPDGEPELLILP